MIWDAEARASAGHRLEFGPSKFEYSNDSDAIPIALHLVYANLEISASQRGFLEDPDGVEHIVC